MLSVTQLARACGVSRTAVLYYESLGLLPAPPRSTGNYRQYGEKHLSRLRQICSYRGAGLKLADVRTALGERSDPPG
jgi:DNA-binding transcriptional MerR regulator